MEINNKFIKMLHKLDEIDISNELRKTLATDIKELRDKVFNALSDVSLVSSSDKNKYDSVNHPKHYAEGGIECIDAMEAAYGTEAVMHFCQCNAFKYQWRFDKKNGEEDIKKAQWYQDRYLKLKKKLRNKDEG